VTCDSGTNVIQLDISDLKIKGTIPSSLGTLDDLSVLDLSNNSLYGSIPKQLGNCNKLQDLDVSYNNFSDYVPTTLCNDKLKNITVDRDLVSSNTDLECYAACLTALAGFEGGVPQPSCNHSPTTGIAVVVVVVVTVVLVNVLVVLVIIIFIIIIGLS